MPVVKQVTYYSFDELSDHAQQKILETIRSEWHYLFETDEEWLIEDIVENHPHITGMDIKYSGFHSQGDGASFTGNLDSEWAIDYIRENYGQEPSPTEQESRWNGSENLRYIGVSFERNSHHYCHENTVNTELCDSVEWAVHIEENDRLVRECNKMIPDFVELLEEYRRDLCNTIYDRLHIAYEHCYSDENIIELIRCHDYLFDEYGNFE